MIASGFERVGEAFDRAFADQREGGLAFAATVEGEPVVDLVAGDARLGEPWTHETRSGVASITKGWAVMCFQICFDRGLVTLDTPIVEIWPEFGAHGKERTLVRHLLEHTAGAIGVGDAASLVQWDGGGWDDLDAIARRLADTPPAWEPGTRCGYHAVTFGWLMGELIRRLDGRTLGTFFREEIAVPLGLRTAIGVPRAEQGDIAEQITGGVLEAKSWLERRLLARVPAELRDPRTLAGQAFLADGERSIMDAIDDLVADGRFVEAEVPASNGVTSAVDLAHLYAVLAGGGELDGLRLFSSDSMQTFLEPGRRYEDAVMTSFATGPIVGPLVRRLAAVQRTVGGYDANRVRRAGSPFGPEPWTVGNQGAGGQVVFADPVNRVSGAFIRSRLGSSDAPQIALARALYDSVGPARRAPDRPRPPTPRSSPP